MSPSPLALERAFFRKVAIESTLEAETAPPQKIETLVTVGMDPHQPLRFQVSLTVRVLKGGEKPSGYVGEIEVIGIFVISESVTGEKREQLVAVHGSTLLYGMVREMVFNVTARGPWPMFTLPVVSFADMRPTVLPAAPVETKAPAAVEAARAN